jgi:hypothetical protein
MKYLLLLILLSGCEKKQEPIWTKDEINRLQLENYSQQLNNARHELTIKTHEYRMLQESKCSDHFEHVDGKLYKRIK